MKSAVLRRVNAPPTRLAAQRGIALLTALFIVALVTVAAAAVYASQALALKRAANQRDGEQAWAYAIGLEDWVRTVLIRDSKLTKTDSFKDIWAQQGVVFPVENGTLSGRVVDLQGAFNLNNLTLPLATTGQAQLDTFARLVTNLETQMTASGLNTSRNGERPATGAELAAAIRDWADADSEPTGTGGAEDSEYLSRQPALRTAGRPILDVSEIRVVRGMTPELYAALTHCGTRGESCIAALPLQRPPPTNPPPVEGAPVVLQPTPINLNTAPLPLLKALAGADAGRAQQFEASRVQKPLDGPGAAYGPDGFITQPPTQLPVPGQQSAPNPLVPLSVQSSWFRLESISGIGGTQVALYSTLFRPVGGGPPGVYYRSSAPG